MSKAQYHSLVAAKVLFVVTGVVDEKGDPIAQTVELNTIVRSDKPTITAKNIAQAQQAVQLNLHNMVEGEVNVANVIILGISPLGLMTTEEFNAGLLDEQTQAAANSVFKQ